MSARHSFRLSLAAGCLLWSACAPETTPTPTQGAAGRAAALAPLSSRPLAAREQRGPGETLFEALDPEDSGVQVSNPFRWDHPQRHLFEHGFAGGGVAIGDVDGDGLPDLYLSSQTQPDTLYRQLKPLVFEDVSERAGLTRAVEWGAGAAFGDLDQDGDLDLFVCNYDAPNRLYLNRGDGSFEERGAERGVDFRGASVMACLADYDCDGDLDIYLVTNRLYPGPGRDAPETERVDGKLRIAKAGEESYEIVSALVDGEPQRYLGKSGQPDRLYRNDGQGHFELVTREAGLWHLGPGLAATWWDYDEDGLPDLYVGNDYFSADRLYHNLGQGRFEDVTLAALPHTPWFSMGNAAADLDGDGRLDLVATDMAASTHYRSKLMMGDMADSRWFLESAEPRQYMRNSVYRNTGTGRFMELAQLSGLASTDWTWSVKLADLDLDGRVDAYFTNGSANNTFEPDLQRRVGQLREELQAEGRPAAEVLEAQWQLYRSLEPRRERNLAFRNQGEWDFDEVGAAWGLGEEVISYGAALSDLDRDGDLDLVVNHLGATARVYRNRSDEGNAILVQLVGVRSEPSGLGARVEVTLAEGSRLVRYLSSASGFMSADEALLHFGLGRAERVSELRVLWPSGCVQRFANLEVNRLYTVVESGDELRAPQRVQQPRYVEQALDRGLSGAAHREEPFDDYERQPLLPLKLSQTGPGLALGDADADGHLELFVGGSAGHAGSLYRGLPSGGFGLVDGPWAQDAAAEDSALLWFDADSDGDQDLFVGSGGVECEAGSELLLDRLYLNQGGLRFERAAKSWLAPEPAQPSQRASTGCAVAADFDADGRLDLFLGARSIPARYPLAPASRLLFGTGTGFEDRTDAWAPGLRSLGMLTSALASDVDLDGRLDLLVALDWGGLHYWHNGGAGFTDRSAASGLAGQQGWWNSLAAGDFDADGDQDYVLLGAGLNTKYHVDGGQTARLYFGDFEGSGHANIIEAKAGAQLLPVRGLSCSSGPIPSLHSRTPSFELFAGSTLPEIYGDQALEQALRFEVNELQSGIWFNDLEPSGARRLRWVPLPRSAQASPGYGSVTGDFDGDGHCDLYFLQNFHQREPETGRLDGGLSLLLEGDGSGVLRAVPTHRSGLLVPGDGTALVSLDQDQDGTLDFLAAENQGPLRLFIGTPDGSRSTLALRGLAADGSAIGARVSFLNGPGKGRCVELGAGGGWLSQGSSLIPFGYPTDRGEGSPGPLEVRIRWPEGLESQARLMPGEGPHRLQHPLR